MLIISRNKVFKEKMLEKGPIFFKKGRLQVLRDEKKQKKEVEFVKID